MTLYVYIYLAYILLCYGLTIITRKVHFSNKQIISLLFILIILNSTIVSLRPIYETADTSIYYNVWNEITLKFLNENTSITDLFANRNFYSIEISFLYLMAFLKNIMSFRIFLWVISFTISCLTCYSLTLLAAYGLNIYNDKSKFTYYYKHELIHIWTVYLVLMGMLYTSVAIRSGLSIALCSMGLSIVLTKRKVIRSVLLLILGTLIHTSGVLFVIIWLLIKIVKKTIKQTTVYFFWIGLVFLYFIRISKFTVKTLIHCFNFAKEIFGISGFSTYLSNVIFQFQLREGYIVFFIGLFLALNYKKMYFLSSFAVLTIIGLAIQTFGAPIHAIARVTDLFLLFFIPIICSGNNLNKDWKVDFSYLGLPFILYPQIILCFARIVK